MRASLARLRRRLSFANVTSAIALFVALGGTSYAAITLPANSVGTTQIRTNGVGKSEVRSRAAGKSEVATNAVGPSEIAKAAIDSDELEDGGVELGDLSAAARGELGTTDRAAVTGSGLASGGTARSVARTAVGRYTVDFGRDVSQCQAAATPAAVRNGGATDEPQPGARTAVAPGGTANQVAVRTYGTGAAGAVVDADVPFHVIVAC